VKYKIGRVNLPPFSEGAWNSSKACDWKRDILEKLESPRLAEIAPEVHAMYSRFALTENEQEIMLAYVLDNHSVFDAACTWLTDNTTKKDWKKEWISSSCDAGEYLSNLASNRTKTECTACGPGYFSKKGATSCDQCHPGASRMLR
jgi:hypothetical protein